jgi:hypothetical protein
MFGPRGIKQHIAAKDRASALPHIKVTEEEFIARMIASGRTATDARLQAAMAKAFGSAVMIGDEIVKIH